MTGVWIHSATAPAGGRHQMPPQSIRRVRLPLVFFALATAAAGCYQQSSPSTSHTTVAKQSLPAASAVAPSLSDDPGLTLPALSGTPTTDQAIQVLPGGNVVDGAAPKAV